MPSFLQPQDFLVYWDVYIIFFFLLIPTPGQLNINGTASTHRLAFSFVCYVTCVVLGFNMVSFSCDVSAGTRAGIQVS